MPNKCVAYGQQSDKLGQPFNIPYKGSSSFGTALGGYVSLVASIFIWGVSILEIYKCFYSPSTILYQSWTQLEVPNESTYSISTVEGFPSFQIYSPYTEIYNDDSLFEYWYSIDTYDGS